MRQIIEIGLDKDFRTLREALKIMTNLVCAKISLDKDLIQGVCELIQKALNAKDNDCQLIGLFCLSELSDNKDS